MCQLYNPESASDWLYSQRDVLQTVIEVCLAKGYDVYVMLATVLLLNFVSIHNTSNVRNSTTSYCSAEADIEASPLRALHKRSST